LTGSTLRSEKGTKSKVLKLGFYSPPDMKNSLGNSQARGRGFESHHPLQLGKQGVPAW